MEIASNYENFRYHAEKKQFFSLEIHLVQSLSDPQLQRVPDQEFPPIISSATGMNGKLQVQLIMPRNFKKIEIGTLVTSNGLNSKCSA
jgi:hypothetical protein